MLSTVLTLATVAFALTFGIDCLAVLIAACCVIDRYAFPSKVANTRQVLIEPKDTPEAEALKRIQLMRDEAAQARLSRFRVHNPAPGGGTPLPAPRRIGQPPGISELTYELFVGNNDDFGDASPA